MNSWIEKELAGCEFADARLSKRFRQVMERLSDGIGESIPFACRDWANTKAAYRFFSNERCSEEEILAGHFIATKERTRAAEGMKLVLHDTTEFSFERKEPERVGFTHKIHTGKETKEGLPIFHTKCGILMHSSLVITQEGLPLGLAAVKFWTRKKFKGSRGLRGKVCFTRIPVEQKESMRWLENLENSTSHLGNPAQLVHVADREGDMYEFFSMARDLETHFLVRICNDRLTEDSSMYEEIEEVAVKGLQRVQVRDKNGNSSEAVLEIKYCRVRVFAPLAKRKKYPPVDMTLIFATERGDPVDREKINWKLATDLSVRSRAEAIEKLEWYASRWKIETFHKILKSGCKAEESKLRTAERLTKLIAVFCILSWRIFWMTIIARAAPDGPRNIAFTENEIKLLDKLVKKRGKPTNALSDYVMKLAQLGGYLARAKDPPPGNKVIWRGLSRLTDISLGFELASQTCG